MTTGDRMKMRRKELGISADEVAAALNVSIATVYRYEKGDIEKVPGTVLAPLAKVLHTTPGWLMGWTDDPLDYDDGDLISEIPLSYIEASDGDVRKARRIMEAVDKDALAERQSPLPPNAIPFAPTGRVPILGTIPAGAAAVMEDDIIGYETVEVPDPENYFCLKVSGDSMVHAGILDGDIVLIKYQPTAENGQIVACRVNGDEATLKRFKKQGDSVILLPENPKYDPRIVGASEFESGYASIIGVAVEVRHKL